MVQDSWYMTLIQDVNQQQAVRWQHSSSLQDSNQQSDVISYCHLGYDTMYSGSWVHVTSIWRVEV